MKYGFMLIILLVSTVVHADTLYLIGGQTFEGKVIDSAEEEIVIESGAGELNVINLEDLESFSMSPPQDSNSDEIVKVTNVLFKGKKTTTKKVFYQNGLELPNNKRSFCDANISEDEAMSLGLVMEYRGDQFLCADRYEYVVENGLPVLYDEGGNSYAEIAYEYGQRVRELVFKNGILLFERGVESGRIVYTKAYDKTGNVIKKGNKK